ncbi:MAG: xylosidase, partial [Flavobacterium sp.]
MKISFSILAFLMVMAFGYSQQKTYCNPINIDYGYCPIPNFVTQGKHRATADPVITYFKDKYYLFS